MHSFWCFNYFEYAVDLEMKENIGQRVKFSFFSCELFQLKQCNKKMTEYLKESITNTENAIF